jgi:hypothetical protein
MLSKPKTTPAAYSTAMPPITLGDGRPLPETTLMDGFKRLALGEVGALGGLYDARTDRILSNSFLRSTAPLEKVVVTQKMPTLTYRFTTIDTLEEKLNNLDIGHPWTQCTLWTGREQSDW